ncbi:M1 family metallopeptidase [Desmospora activa]|uniref:Peptidase M1-like protein n=1 Tax=Desmospora activa DSM 45169 TaxID=1121389 RepID=A0A2T4ZC48_9BACL|nr:M1 family metallopeptidase [Desmospora activa]PTM59458.1 peptidase M1-like protein [Desmospora activa DSM 45169]
MQIRWVYTVFLVMLIGMGSLGLSLPTAQAAVQPTGKERPYYRLEATYSNESQSVCGHMKVRLPDQRQQAWNEVYFHLYPNAFKDWKWGAESKPEKPGYLKVNKVKVDGVPVSTQEKGTLLKVKLKRPLKTGETAEVEMDYELKIPKGGTRLNVYGNTAFLAQWYPMLAVHDSKGWHTDPYTTTGDPFFSQVSDFEVKFQVPKGYQIISSARDAEKPTSTVFLRQARVRDFAVVITKDYEPIKGKIGNTSVNLWYLKGMEDVAQPLHDAAVSSMSFFTKKFGAYPYREVDVVLGETGYGIAGMEYPGLVTSVARIPTRNGEQAAVNVVAHELAHQWWYGVVGNNQVKEPWLDEGLTTFSELLFMHDQMGQNEREWLMRAAQRTDEIYKQKGVTSVESLYKYSDPIYGLMVYTRPAAMMWELVDRLGKEQVLKILHTYYDQYQFQTATTEDFIQVANRVSGQNLRPFFERWLYFKG